MADMADKEHGKQTNNMDSADATGDDMSVGILVSTEKKRTGIVLGRETERSLVLGHLLDFVCLVLLVVTQHACFGVYLGTMLAASSCCRPLLYIMRS